MGYASGMADTDQPLQGRDRTAKVASSVMLARSLIALVTLAAD